MPSSLGQLPALFHPHSLSYPRPRARHGDQGCWQLLAPFGFSVLPFGSVKIPAQSLLLPGGSLQRQTPESMRQQSKTPLLLCYKTFTAWNRTGGRVGVFKVSQRTSAHTCSHKGRDQNPIPGPEERAGRADAGVLPGSSSSCAQPEPSCAFLSSREQDKSLITDNNCHLGDRHPPSSASSGRGAAVPPSWRRVRSGLVLRCPAGRKNHSRVPQHTALCCSLGPGRPSLSLIHI